MVLTSPVPASKIASPPRFNPLASFLTLMVISCPALTFSGIIKTSLPTPLTNFKSTSKTFAFSGR